jgi:hypothetical protein
LAGGSGASLHRTASVANGFGRLGAPLDGGRKKRELVSSTVDKRWPRLYA